MKKIVLVILLIAMLFVLVPEAKAASENPYCYTFRNYVGTAMARICVSHWIAYSPSRHTVWNTQTPVCSYTNYAPFSVSSTYKSWYPAVNVETTGTAHAKCGATIKHSSGTIMKTDAWVKIYRSGTSGQYGSNNHN